MQECWLFGLRILVRLNPTRRHIMVFTAPSHLLLCVCTVQTHSWVYFCIHSLDLFFILQKFNAPSKVLCYIPSLYIRHETTDSSLSLNQGCMWHKATLLYSTKHDEFPLALGSSLAAQHMECFLNLVNWWIYFMFPSGKGRQNLEGDWPNHLFVILMQSNLICYW